MKARSYLVGAAVGTLFGLLSGLLLGWQLWHVEPAREGPAFEKPLSGGGVVLQRDPAAKPSEPVKTAAAEAGGKLERSISVTVQPKPLQTSVHENHEANLASRTSGAETLSVPACSCATVTVDLGLVRMPDDTRRVVAKAQGGDILAAIDIPGTLDLRTPEPRWEAGVLVNPLQPTEAGAIVLRSAGPFRLGAAAIHLDSGGWVPFAVATLKLR